MDKTIWLSTAFERYEQSLLQVTPQKQFRFKMASDEANRIFNGEQHTV